MEDYYAILNVAPTASREEIKNSYKKLGLMYHPDKNQENDSTEKFLEIFRAWDRLGDPGNRAVYDAQRLSYKWNMEALARQGREKREGEAKRLKEVREIFV
jgi:DnaJ-class molecular chaperone